MTPNAIASVLLASVSDRDFPEDFRAENGRYLCLCVGCDYTFFGHKRRVMCRLCSTPKGTTV